MGARCASRWRKWKISVGLRPADVLRSAGSCRQLLCSGNACCLQSNLTTRAACEAVGRLAWNKYSGFLPATLVRAVGRRAEDTPYDSIALRAFAGIDLVGRNVPAVTTLLKFLLMLAELTDARTVRRNRQLAVRARTIDYGARAG